MLKGKGLQVAIIILGIFMFITIFAIDIFLYQKCQLLQGQVRQEREKLADTQKKVKALPRLILEREELEKEQKKLANFIPNNEKQAEFILELEKLAQNSNVDIISCAMNNKVKIFKDLKKYDVYKWNLEIDANYNGLTSFLNDLASASRLVRVAELKVQTHTGDSKAKQYPYRLNVKMVLDLVTFSNQKKVG